MVKKIILENQQGVDPKHNLWTVEALEEMFDLFPEFKDMFEIESRGNYKPQSSEIDQTEYDKLPDDNIKQQYIKLPSGKYLVPYASTDWYIERTKQQSTNNSFDSEILTKLHSDAKDPENPLTITLTVDNFAPASSGFGVQNLGASISTADFNDDINKELFKNIIKHEMGHVFRATYSARSNIIEQDGQHCTNADCIMEASGPNFTQHLSQYLDKPFCDECIEAMRENLRDLLENENALEINSLGLPETNHVDSSWKQPLREFYMQSAADKKLSYAENTTAKNFQAQLRHTDGSVTNIEASDVKTIALSAVSKDGQPEVPGQEHFNDIVAYARKNNLSAVKLGNIRTPEFKARMVLACMSAVPTMKMLNSPVLDEAFFNGVEAATRAKIEALAAQNQNGNNNNNTNPGPNYNPNPRPRSLGGSSYAISRNKTITRLEQKEKLGTITPVEQKKLDYARFKIKKDVELEAALQRTGNSVDPRTAEHIARTGLQPEDYSFHGKRNGDKAWKLHLDVMPNRNDPTTKAVSEMLEQLDIDHKIYHGGENGKGMTIYVGGYEDAKRLSKEINMRFGNDIAEPPIYTDQAGSESMFNHVVSGRFYLQNIFETQYPHGTVEGICPATYGSLADENSESFIFAQALKENILPAGTSAGDCFGIGSNWDFEKRYAFNALEAYCSHKLYEKHLGELYNGKNANLYEQKMFENIVPAVGSPERLTWDKIADSFEKHIAKEYPRGIAEMKKMAVNYTPVDFSKLPPVQGNSNHNNRGGGRP